ncbi:MAG: hypothetical protein A3J09_00090 [Candidatus Zambryskibacteria bacterium RIFCSPLOWO2_02_FULL_51_21]|nr:MAG: hypothetical protein A2723_00090 [Candidatus Zambryskibacteria bacterium RIFCSPHIGHO2_01_FULL_52_18]OHB10972.1 MAG: hypothetical protein A3J09_00090 [Candidatus Zambryskibacteria bacterium RIFCSPLOWO2_02_FULL_51_21]
MLLVRVVVTILITFMKKAIKKLLQSIGLSIVRTRDLNDPQKLFPLRGEHLFDIYFSKIDPANFFFVQIGAYDGKHKDPIYPFIVKYNLRGIVIEPQSEVFPLLQKNYAECPNVRCLNVAIANKKGFVTLYVPEKETSIASLDKNRLERTIKSQTNDVGTIREIEVEALTFEDVMAGQNRLDLLQIDCEGYDWEILKTIDLGKWRPSIINFESVLLSDADKRASVNWLESFGYKWFRNNFDTTAYKV